MKRRDGNVSLGVIVVLASLLGCSSDPGKGTVTGTVTLDGQPLESGLIRFIPIDGQTPTADSMVADGKFSAQVPIGEKRVSISAPEVVGKRPAYDAPGAPSVDIVEELLPPRYNAASELTLTVTSGKQHVLFDLQIGQ